MFGFHDPKFLLQTQVASTPAYIESPFFFFYFNTHMYFDSSVSFGYFLSWNDFVRFLLGSLKQSNCFPLYGRNALSPSIATNLTIVIQYLNVSLFQVMEDSHFGPSRLMSKLVEDIPSAAVEILNQCHHEEIYKKSSSYNQMSEERKVTYHFFPIQAKESKYRRHFSWHSNERCS